MNNVGDFMRGAKIAAAKTLVTLAAWVVYIAGIVYAEIHGWSMMSKGVNPDFLIWAGLGMVALGVTAIMLPIGLHYAFHSALQRIAAFGFYAVDLAILTLNAVIDFGLTSGGQLPAWASMYTAWIVPSTPVIAAFGWSILLLLDPEQAEISMTESLKQSARLALAARLAKKASREDLDAQLDQTADTIAEDLFSGILNDAQRRAAPRNVIPAQARNPRPAPPLPLIHIRRCPRHPPSISLGAPHS